MEETNTKTPFELNCEMRMRKKNRNENMGKS